MSDKPPLWEVRDHRTQKLLTDMVFLTRPAAEHWITDQQNRHERGQRTYTYEQLAHATPELWMRR